MMSEQHRASNSRVWGNKTAAIAVNDEQMTL